jgi:hypothetical protein
MVAGAHVGRVLRPGFVVVVWCKVTSWLHSGSLITTLLVSLAPSLVPHNYSVTADRTFLWLGYLCKRGCTTRPLLFAQTVLAACWML